MVSTTDVWLCDTGYQEVGNSCIPVTEEPEIQADITSNSITTSNLQASTFDATNNDTSSDSAILWTIVIAGGGYVCWKLKKT